MLSLFYYRKTCSIDDEPNRLDDENNNNNTETEILWLAGAEIPGMAFHRPLARTLIGYPKDESLGTNNFIYKKH